MAKKILVNIDLNETYKQKIVFACPDAQIEFTPSGNDYEAVVGSINAKMLAEYPKLTWFHSETAGVEKYLKLLPENIVLSNSSGAYGYAIAEEMVGYTYALAKKMAGYFKNQSEHKWLNLGMVKDVGEMRVLVVGLGDIGSRYAIRMKALGCMVTGIRRTIREKPEYVDEVTTLDRLDICLPQADVVALCLPATNATYHLINYERLLKFKPDAILLNVGRGNAIVTDDLVKAVKEGHLGGVYLDVTDPEPLGKDNPLWDLRDTIITPHVTGNYNLERTINNVVNIAIENINRFCKGQKLLNVVDREIGYRENR